MIKKLQHKFIMITMLSLTLVLLLLVSSINIINFIHTNRRINGAIQILSDNQGKFPKFEKKKIPKRNDKNPPIRKPNFGFQMNEETPFETRYFTVKTKENGNIREIDTSHIAAVSSKDAADYTEKVLSTGKDEGFTGIYKYAVVKQDYGYLLIFLDCRSQLQTAYFVLIISIAVAIGTLLLMFILVSIFSRRAIKPIILSMEKQKQFITDAGHEIKTPLAIISANADVLELTNGNNEWITSIRNQTSRLDKLVKNLLMLSKMDEDTVQMMFHDFDLSKAVTEIAGSFEALAKTQDKNLILNITPGIIFHGDEDSIHQLISTLTDNAVKYSSPNGVIRISLTTVKKGIKLEVYNTVQALPAKNLNLLFERFYRADSSRSRETGGYGIGLSIAKSIVEAHHGKITVKSQDGKSVCFTVFLEQNKSR